MLFTVAFLTLQAWAATTMAQSLNTSREFYLHTQVKDGQTGKEAFNDLWLYAYHTGAGTNDAMLSGNKSHARPAFLNASDISSPHGKPLSNLVMDLGTPDIPWSVRPDSTVNLYAAWRPVTINAGGAATDYNAFFINETGVQWTDSAGGTNAEGFGGWYVCKWWHSDIDGPTPGPQLFFRVNGFGHIELETCADVNLIPEYI